MRRDSSLHTPSTSPVLGMASGVQTLLVCSVGRIIHKVVLAISRSLLSNYSRVIVQLPLLAQWIPPHSAVKPPLSPPPDLQQHQKVNNSRDMWVCLLYLLTIIQFLKNGWVFLRNGCYTMKPATIDHFYAALEHLPTNSCNPKTLIVKKK